MIMSENFSKDLEQMRGPWRPPPPLPPPPPPPPPKKKIRFGFFVKILLLENSK